MSKPHHHKCTNGACGHIWKHSEPTHGWRSPQQFEDYHTCPKCRTCALDETGACDKVDAQGNPTGPTARYDAVGAIIAYEQGDLSDEKTIELFQHLVDSGLAWQLQGHYGRTAHALIQSGLVQERRA